MGRGGEAAPGPAGCAPAQGWSPRNCAERRARRQRARAIPPQPTAPSHLHPQPLFPSPCHPRPLIPAPPSPHRTRQQLRDDGPLVSVDAVGADDDGVLPLAERLLLHLRVQLVAPPGVGAGRGRRAAGEEGRVRWAAREAGAVAALCRVAARAAARASRPLITRGSRAAAGSRPNHAVAADPRPAGSPQAAALAAAAGDAGGDDGPVLGAVVEDELAQQLILLWSDWWWGRGVPSGEGEQRCGVRGRGACWPLRSGPGGGGKGDWQQGDGRGAAARPRRGQARGGNAGQPAPPASPAAGPSLAASPAPRPALHCAWHGPSPAQGRARHAGGGAHLGRPSPLLVVPLLRIRAAAHGAGLLRAVALGGLAGASRAGCASLEGRQGGEAGREEAGQRRSVRGVAAEASAKSAGAGAAKGFALQFVFGAFFSSASWALTRFRFQDRRTEARRPRRATGLPHCRLAAPPRPCSSPQHPSTNAVTMSGAAAAAAAGPTTTGAEELVREAIAQGIDVCFANPGGQAEEGGDRGRLLRATRRRASSRRRRSGTPRRGLVYPLCV